LNYSSPRDEGEPVYLGLTGATWGKIGIIAALFAAVFWPNLRRLWQKTNPINGEPNWSHSFFVPLIGLYYLYVHREEILKAKPRQFIWGAFTRRSRLWVGGIMLVGGMLLSQLPRLLGLDENIAIDLFVAGNQALVIFGLLVILLDWSLAITLCGLGLFVYGIYPGQNDYLKDLGMVVTLFGIVLLMCGWDVMHIAWFPIVFLICALPWPGLVYSKVAEPLQQMAANVAVDVLKITGVNAVCSGTKIIMGNPTLGMPNRVLNVAEACAGMRSLMTFIAVAAAVGFLSARPLWEKLVITASAVPIAIFCNVVRVSGQGLLDHYATQKLSEGFAHQFVGMMMLLPAFFLILGVGALLDKLFIEEVDDRERTTPGVTVVAKPKPPVTPVVQQQPPPPPQPQQAKAPATPVVQAKAQTTAAPKVAAIPARPAPPRVQPPAAIPAKPVTPPRPAGLTPGARPVTSPRPAQPRSPLKPPAGSVPPKPKAPPGDDATKKEQQS
jgi:exosortase